MKFEYRKEELPDLMRADKKVLHRLILVEPMVSNFEIQATRDGVRFVGETALFLPVEGENHIPQDFGEFAARLDSAFNLAWQERQKDVKDARARETILGGA